MVRQWRKPPLKRTPSDSVVRTENNLLSGTCLCRYHTRSCLCVFAGLLPLTGMSPSFQVWNSSMCPTRSQSSLTSLERTTAATFYEPAASCTFILAPGALLPWGGEKTPVLVLPERKNSNGETEAWHKQNILLVEQQVLRVHLWELKAGQPRRGKWWRSFVSPVLHPGSGTFWWLIDSLHPLSAYARLFLLRMLWPIMHTERPMGGGPNCSANYIITSTG